MGERSLEKLINTPETTEQQLQSFFEEHPNFLPSYGYSQPLPHISLLDKYGRALIPDFILKPIVGIQRDNNWEVFDLKRPQVKLISSVKFHPKFSAEVNHAITQLKDYEDYFQNPENSANVREKLDHELKYPRLGVLIGRLPTGMELDELNKQQFREHDVRIVTYDEVLGMMSEQIA